MEKVYSLTPLQEGIWNQIKLFGESTEYEIPCFIEISKSYTDIDIEKALQKIVHYNSVLRTNVFGSSKPKQSISDSREITLNVEYFDDNIEDEILRTFLNSNFVNIDSQLSIFKLYCFPRRKILACKFHHIIFDGYSVSLFERELNLLLTGKSLDKSGGEYEELLENKNSSYSERSKLFWKKYLAQPIEILESNNFNSLQGRKRTSRKLDLKVSDLKKYAMEYGSTEFCLALAAIKTFSCCFFNKPDLVIATPINTRKTIPDNSTMNFMVNVLPIIMSITPDISVTKIHSHIRDTLVKLIDYCDYPTLKINNDLKKINKIEKLGNMFSIVFDMKIVDNSELERISMDYSTETEYPFLISLNLSGDSVYLELNYDQSIISDLVASEFQNSFKVFINLFLENQDRIIAELPLTSDSLQDKELNLTIEESDYSKQTLDASFINKENTEIICDNVRLSSDVLKSLSESFGRFLLENNISSGAKIAVCNNNKILNAALFYCIQDNKCCYIPIDSEYPKKRIFEILYDSDPMFLFSDIDGLRFERKIFLKCFDELKNFFSTSSVSFDLPRDGYLPEISYVIFTSGSTGKPKGVPISYKNLHSLLANYEKYFEIHEGDRVAQVSSFSFDASIFEMTLAYSKGAKLVIFDKLKGFDSFPKFIRENSITHFLLTPDLYTILDFSECLSLKCVVIGGSDYKENKTLPPKIRLINAYGPSEATIMTTLKVIDKYTTLDNIGKPLDNSKVVLVNKFGQIVSRGIPGEICIKGSSVFNGYLGVDNTSTFKIIKFNNQLIQCYPTGDIGYFDDNYDLHFVSRTNNLIKIRGNRVDPNEISRILMDKLYVKNSVTIFYNENLYTFYSGIQSVNKLFESLKELLPNYMIPKSIIQLESIPLNINGKPDTEALQNRIDEFNNTSTVNSNSSFIDLGPMEKDVLSTVRKILRNPEVYIKSNFFAEGGDSIKSIQIATELAQKGYNISSVDILKSNSIGDICKSKLKSKEKYNQSPIIGSIDLTPIQKWFFDHKFHNINFWNQSEVFDVEGEYSKEDFREYFNKIRLKHDNIRIKFKKENDNWTAKIRKNNLSELDREFTFIKMLEIESQQLQNKTNEIKQELNESLDIEEGLLNKICIIQYGQTNFRVIWVMHHLICDNISWSILKSDLLFLLDKENNSDLLHKETNIKQWTDYLKQYEISEETRTIWKNYIGNLDNLDNGFVEQNINSPMSMKVLDNYFVAERLLDYLEKQNISLDLFWLVVFGRSIAKALDKETIWISKESNGRNNHPDNIQLDRLVGWLTAMYPIAVENHRTLKESLSSNQFSIEQMSSIGFDYQNIYSKFQTANISFNYLGDIESEGDFANIVATSDINRFDFFDEIALNVIRFNKKFVLIMMFKERNSSVVEKIIDFIEEDISDDFDQEHGVLGFGLSQDTIISLEDLF